MKKLSSSPTVAARDIWVVIPGFNEEKYIKKVLAKIKKITANIVFVDDGSADRTSILAQQAISEVLVHRLNLGKGAALKTGCDYAFNVLGARAVVIMDADDQHDARELPLFFQALQKQQLVLGARALDQKMPIWRRWGNRFLSGLIWLLFGVYVPDILSGYKGFTSSVYSRLYWQSSSYGVETEMAIKIAKKKIPFAVVPIQTIYHDLDRGMTILDSVEIMIQIILGRIFP